MIRIAQIGAGRMGALHARNAAASRRLDLAWIVDHDPGRAATLGAAVGAEAATLEQVLADDRVKGVIVTSSTDALLANSLACLDAGKAVFCEKPLSLSPAEIEAAEAKLDGPLFVAFNRRFDPHIAALKARLDGGEIGNVETLHLVSHDPATPPLDFVPRSGGLFKDFTVHDFDTAIWLLGEPVAEVFAWASCLIDPAIADLGDSDTAKIVMTTASGRLAMISNSRRSGYGYDQRIEAFGAEGALKTVNFAATTVESWGEAGARGEPFHHAFPDRYAEAYRLEMDHFADMIEQGTPPRTGYRDALAALRLAEAAAASAASGRSIAVDEG